MTVYVDDFRCPATVNSIRGRWSHLTADTPDELHAFAAKLGHKREWFQARCRLSSCPSVDDGTPGVGTCVHFHYDVVDSRRTRAIALGAVAVGIRELGALISARREAVR